MKALFSNISAKVWCQAPNTQNTDDGKKDFIRDIISPSAVNKTYKTQAIPKFAHASPLIFFMNVVFFNVLVRVILFLFV